MLVPISYAKGAGNTAIYLRVRNSTGYYWDFVGLGWLANETADCKRFFIEHADSDPDESLYMVEVTFPANGPWVTEAVRAVDNSRLGVETTAIDAVSADLNDIQATQADMNTALTMLLANDETLLDIGQGDWQVVDNQMIFFKRDGTELMRFDLKNRAGSPAESNVFKRSKV